MNYDKLISKMEEYEGFRAKPYYCSAGKLTIGYGRTTGISGMNDVTTKAAEEIWLRMYVANLEKEIISHSKDLGYNFKEYQIQALIDFCYNLGIGKLNQLTNMGKRSIKEISDTIPEYCKYTDPKTKLKLVSSGLKRRRLWEKDLFDGKLEKDDPVIKANPTAKDLQKLVNEVSGANLEIDGKIGKKTIKATYDYIMEVKDHE